MGSNSWLQKYTFLFGVSIYLLILTVGISLKFTIAQVLIWAVVCSCSFVLFRGDKLFYEKIREGKRVVYVVLFYFVFILSLYIFNIMQIVTNDLNIFFRFLLIFLVVFVAFNLLSFLVVKMKFNNGDEIAFYIDRMDSFFTINCICSFSIAGVFSTSVGDILVVLTKSLLNVLVCLQYLFMYFSVSGLVDKEMLKDA